MSTPLPQLAGTYTIDPAHSRLGFVTRHAMVTKVRGSFDEFEGTATLAGDRLAGSSVEVTMQAASFDSRNADRDAHVKGGDFLDVEVYPTLTFRSTAVEVVSDDEVRITGDLTIKHVTKPVTIPFEYQGSAQDPFGNNRIGFEGSTKINREEFGLTWNAALETGGVLVSKDITLEIEISAVQAS